MLFVVYYAYGTQLSVYTALAGDFYGPKHSAANYGILLLAWGTAGIFGPLVGGQVFTATGSIRWRFTWRPARRSPRFCSSRWRSRRWKSKIRHRRRRAGADLVSAGHQASPDG